MESFIIKQNVKEICCAKIKIKIIAHKQIYDTFVFIKHNKCLYKTLGKAYILTFTFLVREEILHVLFKVKN